MKKVRNLIFILLKKLLGAKYYGFLLFLMHLNNKKFKGYSLEKNINHLNKIIEKYNVNTILDYGCGKAMLYKEHPFKKKNIKINLYDPYYFKYSKKPKNTFDLVICTDVMEHIEKHNISLVLKDINNMSNKIVYFSIATTKAKKNLADGNNAHVSIYSKEYWKKMIKETINKEVYILFNNNNFVEKIS